MADELRKLRREAEEAADRFWFIGALEEMERTDITLSIRMGLSRDMNRYPRDWNPNRSTGFWLASKTFCSN
ncbi:MAG: hypothetical protein FJ011_25720, partial [Chloroflexi bacterium]|nr:hypothetical protein [Chloroflexota bacterium]